MKKLWPIIGVAACSSASQPQQPAPRAGFPVYDGSVVVTPETKRLTAQWNIAFVPDTSTADSVTLLLNRGLQVSSVSGPHIAAYAVKDSGGHNRITLRFTPNIVPGDRVAFDVAYAGTPFFSEDSINSIRSDWIELGLDAFWHPVFSSFNQYIVARMRLIQPANWDAIASGTVVRATDIIVSNQVPLIDIAFAAAPQVFEKTLGGTTVYYVNSDSATVQRVLSTTAACGTYLNQRYAEREQLPHAKIVLAPRKGPGYARKNYIVISDVSTLPGDALDRYICHELAHFWSSGAVSSGPENWLNEAMAEFVSARFVRESRGGEAYQKILQQWIDAGKDQPPVWTPATTRRPGPRVAYRKAPHILHQLEQQVGSAVMERILARYMVNRITNTPALLDVVAQIAGPTAAAWLAAELGK